MRHTERPLSPHLTVYRWPITMMLSILHRITGVAMSAGLVCMAIWLVQAAAGPEDYQYFRAAMSSVTGQILLIGWTFAYFLHLANGVRHLVWDTGRGFEKTQVNASAWFVLLLAVVLTTAFWVLRT